jgi:hypothetical protein
MATIKHGNFSFADPGDKVPDGSTIHGGNFSQLVPGTEILKGKKLTIHGGNFVNVKKQSEWTIDGGNWCQVERCSHLHPEWVERGLEECAADCKHRSADKEWIELSDADEFRKEKALLAANDIKVNNTTDSDGVVTQTFCVRKYVYRDKVL